MAKHPKLAEWEENELAKSMGRFPERREKFTNHGGDEVDRINFPKGTLLIIFKIDSYAPAGVGT